MTTYALRNERYRTCRLVFVLQDGAQRHRTANAHLSTGAQGDYAIVYVPAHAEPVNAPSRQPDWVDSRNGYAMYDFTSHQDALDFLCALYGITPDQPTQDADAESLEASADTLNRVERTVPAFPLLGRDVIHIAPLFWGRAYPHPDHSHPRNRQ
ncbi:hypothetical protein [Halomonas sp. H5]|uniref:hypothetical protein n=1 Tax=Halomonas sp. H5 TaxID=3423910 RepID=UPI003D35F9E0